MTTIDTAGARALALERELAACKLQLAEERKRSARLAAEHAGALRETKAALEFALQSGQIGDWDLDLIADTSRRSLRHDQCFGYDRPIAESEWGIDVFIRHVHPDDRSMVESSLREAVRTLHDWSSEFRVVWPDRSVHWLAARGSIYRTEEGKATRMLGIVMDVTAHKTAETALRASEQLSRGQVEALKSALDALAVETDPERLAGQILRTITDQFGAHSSSAWCRDQATGMLGFEFAVEDGSVVSKTDRRFAGLDLWLPMADIWPWPEVFRTGTPSLIEDIRAVPAFPLRDRLLPMGIVTVLLIPMWAAGRLEGALGLRFQAKRSFRPDEIALSQALANQVMLMIQFTRLSVQAREVAVIAERNRIARDIHDTLAQGFTGVIVQLEAAEDAGLRQLPKQANEHLVRARDLARDSLNEARRSVQALRPRALRDGGLSGALQSLFRTMTRGTGLSSELELLGEPVSLPPEWEDNVFRVVQEILTNALRHAQARRFGAKLMFLPGELRLELRDDGRGFDPSVTSDGYGLLGIRERVEDMGGQFRVRSAPGEGTAVRISLPMANGWAAS